MSVLASTWAWQQAITPNLKLVLVALADHAHDDGSGAYPSKALLSAKTGYSERQVQRILGELVGAGVIRALVGATRYRPTEYALCMSDTFMISRDLSCPPAPTRGDNMSPLSEDPGETSETSRGDTSGTSGETLVSPEPSVEPSVETTTSNAPDGDVGTIPGLDHLEAPATGKGAPEKEPEVPTADSLRRAWFEGWASRHPYDPDPALVKRMLGKARDLARTRETPEHWEVAVEASRRAGEKGVWDLTQVLGGRQGMFWSKLDEERAIYGGERGESLEHHLAAMLEAQRVAAEEGARAQAEHAAHRAAHPVIDTGEGLAEFRRSRKKQPAPLANQPT